MARRQAVPASVCSTLRCQRQLALFALDRQHFGGEIGATCVVSGSAPPGRRRPGRSFKIRQGPCLVEYPVWDAQRSYGPPPVEWPVPLGPPSVNDSGQPEAVVARRLAPLQRLLSLNRQVREPVLGQERVTGRWVSK